jgi:hypothetical protein
MAINEEASVGVAVVIDCRKESKSGSSGIQLNYIEVYSHYLNFTLIIYIHSKPFSVIFITLGQKSTLQKSMF